MSYWADREVDALNRVSDKTIKQTEAQLKKYYADLLQRTLKDFELVYDKIMRAKEEGKDPTPADLYKLDTYWQHQAQLRKELNKLGEKQIALLSKQFEMNWYEVYNSVASVGEPAFSTVDTQLVQQMINSIWCADGKSWSQRIWKNTELLAETLNNTLVHVVATGKSTSDVKLKLYDLLQDEIREDFEEAYNRVDSLVRTEVAHIQTQAATQRYKDAGIMEVQVWASKDERQCKHCGKLHKTKYLIGQPVPIPAHPNCRCNIIPVI
jgi:SPP1 gp7 family putative phage head morphogenesis protein